MKARESTAARSTEAREEAHHQEGRRHGVGDPARDAHQQRAARLRCLTERLRHCLSAPRLVQPK
eukprot:2174804-Alexandrium_andersonii.AAC.1